MTREKYLIPDSVYRMLPFLYISAGILTPIYVSTAMSVVSGVLLLSAGVLVLMWRSAAKAERRRRARRARARLDRALGEDSTSISGYSSSGNSKIRWE